MPAKIRGWGLDRSSSPKGAPLTQGNGIDARGEITGFFLDSSGTQHGFLLSDGIFNPVDFPGATSTRARGINARGEITGSYIDNAGQEHGFVATQ